MANEFITSGGSLQLMTTYIARKFVSALERDLVLAKFTTKVIIPPGMGNVARLVTFPNPPGSVTAITEGTIGNPIDLTTTGTNVTIAEYGEYMHVSQLTDIASPTYRDELAARFAHGGAIAVDTLVRNQHNANTNVYVFQATGNGAAASPQNAVTAANVRGIITARKKLKDAFTRGFRGIPGHPEGAYAAVLGQQAELDMITEVTTSVGITWMQVVTNIPGRAAEENWVGGYMGTVYGTACYSSQNMSTGQSYSGTNATVNSVFGDGAFAAVAFKDMKPDVFINTPTSNSTDNPYRNFNSIAWHIFFGTKINDVNRAVKLYSLGS